MSLADQFRVGERVRWAERVVDAEVPDYLALADVFAMPSTGEGFGIVFLEAAACGVPVIGGNRDGSRDALADGRIGRLVDPLDEAELIEAVATALNRPAKTDGGAIERLQALDRFRFEAFAEHTDELVGLLAVT